MLFLLVNIGIAVIFKKKLFILLLGFLTIGCVKKETPEFGKNEGVNKAYTEDDNGEVIFYDLKKPDPSGKVEEDNDKAFQQNLSDKIKNNSELVVGLTFYKNKNEMVAEVKFKEIISLGDGFSDKLSIEIFKILKALSEYEGKSPKKVVFQQPFSDQSSLKIVYETFRFSNIDKNNVFADVDITHDGPKGLSGNLLKLICENENERNTQLEICGKIVKDVKTEKEPNNEEAVKREYQDGIEKIILDENQSRQFKKNDGLSEDQKKILEEAGFDVSLN